MSNKLTLLFLVLLGFGIMVSAANYNILGASGTKLLTVASNGTTSVVNLSVTQLIEATGNISTDAYFVGDGSYLTGITVDDNSTQLSYHNITDIPTCQTTNVLHFDGTDFSCEATSIAVNSTTISVHNITDIPTCGAGDYLTFDGTDVSCSTPTTSVDWTNNAWLNETQVFAENNNFTKYTIFDEGIKLNDADSVITRYGVESTNISIDDTGNVNIYLG